MAKTKIPPKKSGSSIDDTIQKRAVQVLMIRLKKLRQSLAKNP